MSPEAKVLLEELRERPEWKEIITELKIEKAPLYKPLRISDGKELRPDIQEKNWIYDSGAYKENVRIINTLSGEKK